MKKALKLILFVVCCCLFMTAGSAFGNNITIYDNRSSATTGWYGMQEDQEVEPGMIANQNWDLEAFLLDDFTLSMVGGFNFVNGYTYSGNPYTSGDIFIDTTGDAYYGIDNSPSGPDGDYIPLNYGYEYVIDVDWTSADKSYNVYSLGSSSILSQVGETYNQIESNPFKLDKLNNGTLIDSGNFTYSSFSNPQGTHYQVSDFDLTFIGLDQDFITHFTISCGNDNLMGKGTTPVSEPATMLLFGTGLIGLAGIGRKKFRKKQ